MYAEECEFCWRVIKGGWRVCVANDAHAAAAPGGSSRTLVHAYLKTRNQLELARRIAGVPGSLAALGPILVEILRVIPTPIGRRFWRKPERRSAGARAASMLWGVADFWLRRFGPPPRKLAEGSDVSGT
jgi:GT2 family glycosyltransferase